MAASSRLPTATASDDPSAPRADTDRHPLVPVTAAVVITAVLLVEQTTSAMAIHGVGGTGATVTAASVLGVVLGRSARRPRDSLIPCTLAASLGTTLGAVLRFFAFPTPLSAPAVHLSLAAAGLLGGALASIALRALVRPALRLGVVRDLGSPFGLVAGVLSVGLWLAAMAHLSGVQRAAMMGLVLVTLAAALEGPLGWLYRRPHAAPRLTYAAVLGTAAVQLAALAGALHLTPLSEVAAYPDPIVYAETRARRVVVTASAAGLELFQDHQLVDSPLDGPRMAEGLVRPALWSASSKRSVLVLGGGYGRVGQALLADAAVSEVVIVTPDPGLADLATRVPALSAAMRAMRADPRVRIVVDEPAAWLLEATEAFDVVLLAVGAPVDHMTGKAYTRRVFQAILGRLRPGGVAAIPAGSALQTPRAHASILSAVQGAGLLTTTYHVPLPTLGEWTIVLGAREAPPRPVARGPWNGYFVPGVLAASLTTTPDRQPRDMPPSTLHEPIAVTAFRAERGLDVPHDD